MRKSFLKAAIPTMAMLLVAVMALTGTTYAWFTTTKKATVGTVDIKVTTAQGMKIAVKTSATANANSGWKSTLSANDIKGSYGSTWNDGFASGWEATSTTNAVNTTSHALAFFKAELDPDNANNLKSIVVDTSNYFKFDVYIQNNATTARKCSLADTTVTGDAKTALRLAMIVQGTNTGLDFADISDGGTTATIWSYDAVATSGLKNAFTSTTGTPSVSMTDTTYVGAQTLTSDFGTMKFSIPAQSVAKVTIYYWLEGQDPDCVNALTSKQAALDLVFNMEDNVQN